MDYIVYRRFNDLAICGDVDIAEGTELANEGEFIVFPDGRQITRIYSQNYCRHFSRNDDGQGLKRGKLAYVIAYSERKADNGFRFSDDEQNLIQRDWAHFLIPYADAILFNNYFFDAPVEELEKLAKTLNIEGN